MLGVCMEPAVNGLDYLEWQVESDSTLGKFYNVRLWLRDWRGFKANSLSCDCPRWVYQRKPLSEKSCKHTDRIAEQRLLGSSVVADVHGSEVMFNEQAIESQGMSRVEALKRELNSP